MSPASNQDYIRGGAEAESREPRGRGRVPTLACVSFLVYKKRHSVMFLNVQKRRVGNVAHSRRIKNPPWLGQAAKLGRRRREVSRGHEVTPASTGEAIAAKAKNLSLYMVDCLF